MALNARQRAFVEAYCGNATEAAITAGYSKKTAASIGERLLRNVEIKEALKEREKERLSSLIATREERQRFWTSMMRDEDRKEADRLKASELLAKSEGDFLDRAELSGPNGTPLAPPIIQVVFTDDQDEED
jgi:phage terminase small subunit